MLLQITMSIKSFVTSITWEQKLSSVHMLMSLKMTLVTKGLLTYSTWVWALSIMHTHMYDEITIFTKAFSTHITWVWSLPCMHTLMPLQIYMKTECFFTNITRVWMFCTVCRYMYLKFTLMTKHFLTDFTRVFCSVRCKVHLMWFTSISSLWINFNFQFFICVQTLKEESVLLWTVGTVWKEVLNEVNRSRKMEVCTKVQIPRLQSRSLSWSFIIKVTVHMIVSKEVWSTSLIL